MLVLVDDHPFKENCFMNYFEGCNCNMISHNLIKPPMQNITMNTKSQ